MQYRIAKVSDADQLARLHFVCCSEQAEGFMFKLGVRFLENYYKIFLNEKYSVITVAEFDSKIVGFISGSLKTEEHIESLRKNRLRLLLSAIPEIIRNPILLKQMFIRYKSTDKQDEFVVTSGPRGEYWAWLSSCKDACSSLELHNIQHKLIRSMGVTKIRSEVNAENKRVVKSIQLMGANIIKEISSPTGSKRYIVEYDLEKYL